MSAWIVSKGHIDVLTNGLVQYGLLSPRIEDIRKAGQMLWHENHESVNYRYNEDTPTPDYEPELVESDLDPRAILVAVGCYQYQSCEHEGWADSEARRLVGDLERTVDQHHPEALRQASAAGVYGDDPTWYRWGYEDVREAMSA